MISDKNNFTNNSIIKNYNDTSLLNILTDNRNNNTHEYLYYLNNIITFQKNKLSKLVLHSGLLLSNNINDNSTILNQNTTSLFQQKAQKKFNIGIEKSYLIKEKNILSLVYLFEKNKLNYNLSNSGIKYINSILPSTFGYSDSIWQPSQYNLVNNGIKLNYLVRSKKSNLDFNIASLVNIANTNYNNKLNAKFNNNYYQDIIGFNINEKLNQFYIAFPLEISDRFKKFNWHFNIEPFILKQTINFNNNNTSGLNLNTSLSYKINRNKNLYFNLNSNNTQSSIFDLTGNKYIKNYKDIFLANGNFNIPKYSVLNVSYYSTPLSTKKMTTAINIFHLISNDGLLYNSNYDNGYSNIAIDNIKKSNFSTSISIKNTFYEILKNTKFEVENTFTTAKYYNEQVNVINQYNNTTFKNILFLSSKVFNNFYLELQNDIRINFSKKENSTIIYKNQTNITNFYIKYNFNNTTHFKIDLLNFNTFSKNQSIKINELLLNFDYKQIIKGSKIRIGIRVNNLLNNQEYNSTIRTALQFSSDVTPLIKRYLLFKIEFLL